MDTELALKLRELTIETLEKYCMLIPAASASGNKSASGEKESAASVDFHGPIHGTLAVVVQEPLLNEITKGMLGDQEKYSDKEKFDSLGEIANVVCGNILPYVSGPHAKFDIDSPRVMNADKLKSKTLISKSDIILDDGRFEILFYRDA